MSNDCQQIVNKAWNFAHVLRDDGLSYMDYTEQITFLLFLKMADEQTKPPYNKPPIVPAKFNWESLLKREDDELIAHYRHILEELGKQPGMLGEIFKKARPEIQNPATLRRLIVDLIDVEKWSSMQADVKGDIHEGLLAKSATESPKGAGQYFTPCELIKAIVDCMQPTADDTVCDPAAGTGGFLLAADDYVAKHNGRTSRPRPRPRPSNSTSCNTSRHCSMSMAAVPSWWRITCCSKVGSERQCAAQGRIDDRTNLYHVALRLGLESVCDGQNTLQSQLPFNVIIADKQCNSSGLQLADLVARPIGRKILKPDQPNRAYDVLAKKFALDSDGQLEGRGLTIYPA